MKGLHERDDIVGARYKVIDFVGEGGMQFVYRAFDSVTQRYVALKTPKNTSGEKRFHRSAIVAAKVNHPHVAKTLDYLEAGGKKYLVEEYIEGSDLQHSLLTLASYIDPFLTSRIFLYLAKGLAASHHARVIHRDLKPSNIMISGDFLLSQVKITDFGIAKMAEEEMAEAWEGGTESITASQTVVGALPYMAPEAIETPRTVDVQADIWSLGAMMFEVLCGEKPFGSGLPAVAKIVQAKLPTYPKFVTSKPQFKYLANQLIALINLCLEKTPSNRPTADLLVSNLGNLCYPINIRNKGIVKYPRPHMSFITPPSGQDVFFHKDSVYGTRPAAGDEVMYAEFPGAPSSRAHPVVKLKN